MITDNNSLAGLEQSQMDMEFRDEYEYPQIDLRRGTIKALPSDAGGESRRGTIREFNNELSEARSPFGLQLQKLETESNTPTPFADFINVGTLQETEPDSPLLEEVKAQQSTTSAQVKLNGQNFMEKIKEIENDFSFRSSTKIDAQSPEMIQLQQM